MDGHGLAFEHFLLYETRARYYLVAYTRDKAAWRVLKISRMEPHDLEARARGRRGVRCRETCEQRRTLTCGIPRLRPAQASEDPAVYTERQAAALLRTIADGNAAVGGLSLAARGCGVVGAIRFLEGFYLILITRRRRVGTLAGHAVYAVDDTEARTRARRACVAAKPSRTHACCASAQVIELPHPAAKPPRRAEEQYDEKCARAAQRGREASVAHTRSLCAGAT